MGIFQRLVANFNECTVSVRAPSAGAAIAVTAESVVFAWQGHRSSGGSVRLTANEAKQLSAALQDVADGVDDELSVRRELQKLVLECRSGQAGLVMGSGEDEFWVPLKEPRKLAVAAQDAANELEHLSREAS